MKNLWYYAILNKLTHVWYEISVSVRCDRMCLYSCGTKNKEEMSGKYHKIELDIKIK
jgi:hypothetical protein